MPIYYTKVELSILHNVNWVFNGSDPIKVPYSSYLNKIYFILLYTSERLLNVDWIS